MRGTLIHRGPVRSALAQLLINTPSGPSRLVSARGLNENMMAGEERPRGGDVPTDGWHRERLLHG